MRPLAPCVTVALCAAVLALSAGPVAAEPPPPSDAELTQYIAVQDALVADTARRGAICGMLAEEDEEHESESGDELADMAKRVESNAILGPMVRRAGLSGRRYVELSVQVVSVLLGAAIADQADARARAAGRPPKSRETLLATTPAAAPILAREQALTRALSALQSLCEEGEDDNGDYDEYELEDPGSR